MLSHGDRTQDKLKVFISYSRKDEWFAQDLVAGLEAASFEAFLDRHDIAPGEDWEMRLGRLLEAADTIVIVISPDAITSERCAWEVERAAALRKRLFPIVWRRVDESRIPTHLKQLNYIFFDRPEAFGASLLTLATALRTDLAWTREHTRIGEAALRWHSRGRIDALLMRGEELATASEWLRLQPNFAQEPTPLMHEYIKASQTEEISRESNERQRLGEMEAAQQEREQALAREREALQQAQAAVRRTQRAQKGIGVLLAAMFVGMVGVMNQTFVLRQVNWFWIMRPYKMANFRPNVLSAASERALSPSQEFHECAKDCPTMIVAPAGSFVMGSPDTERGRRRNESPQRRIEIASQFAVSKYPVTFADWDACAAVGGCTKASDSSPMSSLKPVAGGKSLVT